VVAGVRVLPLCALFLVLLSLTASNLAFAQARPEFVYPVNGQTLDYKGSYEFKVKPIANAQKYEWDFLQYGKVELREFTGNEFGIHPGTPEHSKFVPGRIEVSVRAVVKGKWTDHTTIAISAVKGPAGGNVR
jgi:hypothetical protein